MYKCVCVYVNACGIHKICNDDLPIQNDEFLDSYDDDGNISKQGCDSQKQAHDGKLK